MYIYHLKHDITLRILVSKKFGEWNNEEICKPFDYNKKCGNGQQLQTRICQDGTIDICKADETIRYINCYIECESYAPNYEPLVEGKSVNTITISFCLKKLFLFSS